MMWYEDEFNPHSSPQLVLACRSRRDLSPVLVCLRVTRYEKYVWAGGWCIDETAVKLACSKNTPYLMRKGQLSVFLAKFTS